MWKVQFIAGVLGGLYVPLAALAQVPELAEGLSRSDVSKLLGAPIERIEREAKREEEWKYTRSSVTFREGKVTDWSPRVQEPKEPIDPESEEREASDKDSELAGILGVILEEGGEGSDEPAPPAPGRSGPPVPPGVTAIETP